MILSDRLSVLRQTVFFIFFVSNPRLLHTKLEVIGLNLSYISNMTHLISVLYQTRLSFLTMQPEPQDQIWKMVTEAYTS